MRVVAVVLAMAAAAAGPPVFAQVQANLARDQVQVQQVVGALEADVRLRARPAQQSARPPARRRALAAAAPRAPAWERARW